MVQGSDSNSKKFTAFILCNPQQAEQLENAPTSAQALNLEEMRIIYTIAGHLKNYINCKDILNFDHLKLKNNSNASSKDYAEVQNHENAFK